MINRFGDRPKRGRSVNDIVEGDGAALTRHRATLAADDHIRY
jgi:hypothetical protein